MTATNMVGQKYERLVVLDRATNDKHNNARWRCACECGQETVVVGSLLRKGKTRSCGSTLRACRYPELSAWE